MTLSIDSLPQPRWPGLLGLSRCPGTASLLPDPTRKALQQDLDAIRDWGAVAVVTLNEPAELRWLGLEQLGESVRSREMTWWSCPIPDFGAPGADFQAAWNQAGPEVIEALAQGERVLVHCLAGLGRTGTLAAWLLMLQGVGVDGAIAQVRAARPGSVQSEAQRAFLLRQQEILGL